MIVFLHWIFSFFPKKHKDTLKNMTACKLKKPFCDCTMEHLLRKCNHSLYEEQIYPWRYIQDSPITQKQSNVIPPYQKTESLFGESLYARLHLRTDVDRWVKGTASGDTDRPLAGDTKVVFLWCQVYQIHGAEQPSCSVLHNGWVCSEVSVLQSDIYTKTK